MTDTLTPRDEMLAKLERAKSIAEAAERERRGFTNAEEAEVRRLLDDAAGIKKNIAAANADQDLLEQLKSMAMAADGSGPAVGVKTTAASWFASDPDSLTDRIVVGMRTDGVGLKALAPSGSINFDTRIGNVGTPHEVNALWSLVSHQTVSGPEVTYLRQSARTNNAAPVAYGALKPTSVFSVEKITASIVTFAHLSEAIPRQYFEDDATLSQFLRAEMVAGVTNAVDDQIAIGDGTAGNIEGILNVSGTQSQAFSTSPLETIRKALTRLELINARATAIALNPADWETIELDVGTDGQFLFDGLPGDPGRRQLFGVPVTVATAVPVGTAIVGDWRAAELLDRGSGSLSWTETHGDDWSHNLVRWRCELRVGLALKQPLVFVVADLTAA